jgi:hypothetical protein
VAAGGGHWGGRGRGNGVKGCLFFLSVQIETTSLMHQFLATFLAQLLLVGNDQREAEVVQGLLEVDSS